MAQHPYVPQSLQLPGFELNFLSVYYILSIYALASLTVVSIVWFWSGRFRHLLGTNRLLLCWWAFTGLTHIILEGYFVFTPDFYKKKSANFLAEVWKEYSKGDSRYAARDSAVIAVEGVTSVIEGPLCLLAIYAIVMRKSYRHPLQLAICLGQLYGCIIYFATTWLNGAKYSAGVFYYWVYYIFMNNIWVVIPSLIALRSWQKIVQAFQNKQGKRK